MAKSYLDHLKVSEIQIDPNLWGPEEVCEAMRVWLATEYDDKTMPRLAAADVVGREGVWLLGWDHEGTSYPPMLVYLFGQEYADTRMAVMRMAKKVIPDDRTFGMGL